MERFNTLEACIHDCWHLLFRATVRRKEPFNKPVTGTVRGRRPSLRTVVLRSVDIPERRLTFFTDYRSAKVEELRLEPELYWLFYDDRRKLQIRARSRASLHYGDDLARAYWRDIPAAGRRNYAAVRPPGTPAGEATEDLPPGWSDDWTAEQTDFAFRNFLVVRGEVFYLECLHLHGEGHQRAAFDWEGEWRGRWLIS